MNYLPIDEYYTKQDSDYFLREIYRFLERERILMIARVMNQLRAEKHANYVSSAATIIDNTQLAISQIGNELDTAIKGVSREKIEKVLADEVIKYDGVLEE